MYTVDWRQHYIPFEIHNFDIIQWSNPFQSKLIVVEIDASKHGIW